MPIYEYRCSDCGFQNDYLQKMSEPPLSDCPECGKSTFSKQVTAAGFQLKGTGWYVTDFKNNGSSKTAAKSNGNSEGKSAESGSSGESSGTTASAGDSGGACSAST